MRNEYIPTRPIWLVFDLANGHATGRRYVWWFETRRAAESHIYHHKQLKNSVPLSKPKRFFPRNER
jgi:hypothetical protein